MVRGWALKGKGIQLTSAALGGKEIKNVIGHSEHARGTPAALVGTVRKGGENKEALAVLGFNPLGPAVDRRRWLAIRLPLLDEQRRVVIRWRAGFPP